MNAPSPNKVSSTFESLDIRQRSILSKLVAGGVRLTVVGGYAMKFYGSRRPTYDLDLVVVQTQKNIKLIGNSLFSMDMRSNWELLLLPEKKWSQHGVEIFSSMRGIDSVEIHSTAHPFSIYGGVVDIASTPLLRKAKELAVASADRDSEKRLIDLADLEFLKALPQIGAG